MKKYEHLSQEDRYYIQKRRESGESMSKIAITLNCPRSTIFRELKRNTKETEGYCFQVAQAATKMRHAIKTKASKWTEQMAWNITERLLKKWSPEQIVDDLRSKELPYVSVERTYQFVRANEKAGGTLHQHLRHDTASYERGKRKQYKGKIPDRVSISERPSVVDDKSRIGDWEADTMVGKAHQGFLVTLTERVSKLNFAIAVPHKEAGLVKDAILKALLPLKAFVHTITFDNGLEFSQHSKIAQELECETFFADPYSSWQRGLNENHNGLLRQYFPKHMPLNTVTQNEVDFAIAELNAQPILQELIICVFSKV